VFLMYLISPEYMDVLIHDQRGHYILATAALFQVAGMLSIRHILDIRV